MRRQFESTALTFASILLATLAGASASDDVRDALARKPNIEHGRSLYETCAACHQLDGTGEADSGIPIIAGQHYRVVITQLADFRRTERVELRMNAFAARHHLESSQDLADVAAYISELPAKRTKEFGTGEFTGLGAQVYHRACESCHGAGAEGNDQMRQPRLAGQHYGYLVKQVDAMIRGTRYNLNRDHAGIFKSLTKQEIAGLTDYVARLAPDSSTREN